MSRRTTLCRLVACLLVVGAVAVSPAQAGTAPAADTSIQNVGLSGPAVVDYNGSGDRVFLWTDAEQTVTVKLQSDTTDDADQPLEVCLRQARSNTSGSTADDTAAGEPITGPCVETTVTENGSTVTLSADQWPFNGTGKQRVTVTVANETTVLDESSVQVFVLSKSGDVDGDGLSNTAELEHGTNLTAVDTDGDTLEDGPEVNEYGTDPLEADSDDDGARDAQEISAGTDPTTVDTDGDNLSDGFELEHGLDPTAADTDGDGLTDAAERNLGTNPRKKDTDGDGISDYDELKWESDPTEADTDGDGLGDAREYELGTDPTAADTDGDLLSDETEADIGSNPTSIISPLAYIGLLVLVVVIGRLVYTGRIEPAAVPGQLERYVGRDDDSPDPGIETPAVEEGTPGPPDPDTIGPNPTSAPVLTDEEKVCQILRENGGRLQQKEIIEQTDWSKSKVSRLLSKMESEDEIRKISVGRENLITLPEDQPESSKPFF
ncbi:hypothetical protein [Haloarchaeobius sp. HME9146]|uniref:helix-turn-helix transcriptional regulator n=1 Tax=Haloarchaeobius sp. HME9146 TaxID=2978732 RepID=UPI0021C1C545|nr:hypothetical protein [Haloarchaeobius sp. HME9146]MCT9095673.1 hypothetical protein [Haloarchaeobius sp. HME9146]